MAINQSFLARVVQSLKPTIIVLAVVSITIVAVLWLRLEDELGEYRQEAVDNIHWNISQLELDLVRFGAEAEIVQFKSGETLGELRKRYDLFYSRVQSVLKGNMFGKLNLNEVLAPMSARLELYLAETTPLIDGPDPELRAALANLETEAAQLREDLRAMSVKIIERYAVLADLRRAAFADLVQRAAWAGAIVIAALATLSVLVLWLNRQTVRMANQTLRLSSRLAATVETSLDAIIVTDANGRVLDFNKSAAITFGYSAQEAIGADLATLIIPANLHSTYHGLIGCSTEHGSLQEANPGHFKMTGMRKGGEEFPLELAITSDKTADGTIYIAFLRDISVRVQAENALVQARDAAMAAERSKTNFMAVMSHEMHTPLNGVMAALEIASGMAVNAKQVRFLDLAQSSARQLLRHANDVLDISKVEAGKLHLSEEEFDITALTEDLVAGLHQVATQKGTDVTVKPLAPMPRFIGDHFRISQIIQNFLTNALKFTENGQITVEIEAQRRKDALFEVEVRVIDTGIGIAESDQERIFEDFVMLDQSFVRTSGGTGLGLAIARRLAQAMGGEVGVESEVGAGSCFWMRLPLAIASTTAPIVQPNPQAAQAMDPLDVLVVEDNATNRIVLEEMLLQLGHCVTMAADGRQGMEAARAHPFDAILMDISMPVMDGLTATAMIREQGLSMDSRILAVTAHSLPADLERFHKAGMDGCLTKPISLGNLAQSLLGEGDNASQSQAKVQALNPARIEDLREGLGAAGLARMINRYRADFPEYQARLLAACAPERLADLMPICHEGAGVCAMVGLSALQQLYAKAEDLCRNGDEVKAADLINKQGQILWDQAEAALASLDLPT